MRVEPLTPDLWDDFVDLFTRRGPRGGGGPGTGSGCWCMWWRLRRDGESNRLAMRALVEEGTKPGLLAFDRAHAVGWISVARRESYGQLVRSRQYAPRDDDEQVWSIVCLYVHAAERRRRIASLMLDSAIAWAFDAGADAIEVYPATVASRSDYMGAIAGYRKRGFVPVREAGTRTIMRLARYATSP